MLRARHAVILCVISLLTLGIVMVTSAGLAVDAQNRVTVEGILTGRTSIYAAAAVCAMLLGMLVNVDWLVRGQGWTRPLWWLSGIALALLLVVLIPGVGSARGGSMRWIQIGSGESGITFQPSEAAKWLMPIVMALFVVSKGEDLRTFWRGLVPGLALVGAVCGVIITQDLGTAVLIGAVSVLILWTAGVKWWHLAALVPGPVLMIGLAIWMEPYRVDRIRAFLNPYEDPGGKGYHIIQSLVAISGGNFTGRGLGHGIQKFGYLPVDTSDFIFAVICEELGVFGAALVVFLYCLLILAGLAVLRKQPTLFRKLTALGIITTVGLQAVMNLMVVTGMLPTKGIALPLLSSGGTGWLLTACSLGLLVRMDWDAERAERGGEGRAESDDEDVPTLRRLAGERAGHAEGGPAADERAEAARVEVRGIAPAASGAGSTTLAGQG